MYILSINICKLKLKFIIESYLKWYKNCELFIEEVNICEIPNSRNSELSKMTLINGLYLLSWIGDSILLRYQYSLASSVYLVQSQSKSGWLFLREPITDPKIHMGMQNTKNCQHNFEKDKLVGPKVPNFKTHY